MGSNQIDPISRVFGALLCLLGLAVLLLGSAPIGFDLLQTGLLVLIYGRLVSSL